MNAGPAAPPRPATRRRVRPGPFAFVAGALSALVPGAGQLYAGRPRRAAAMALAGAAVAGLALAAWLQGPVFVLRALVQPDVLLWLLAVNAVLFLLRLHCVLDAYKLAGRDRAVHRGRRAAVGGRLLAVAALAALTALPHVAAGYYDFRQYDLLTSVFAEVEPVAPPPPAPLPVAAPPSGPLPVSTPRPGEGPAAPAAPEPAPAAEPVERSWLAGRERLTVLLVGGDAGPGRWGLRTDTMIVVSIDPQTRRAALFGVPRNLREVPFPPTAHTELETFPDILNALWQYAEREPGLFPDAREPGPTALEQTIGHLLGLRIHYYAAVDLRGFVEVVDALGGVTVNVQSHVYDAGVSPPVEGEEWIAIDLPPGSHHLDGRRALAYVRTRWATSDYDRMQRQRCTIGALAEQATLPRLLKAFPKLASALKRYVRTDVPLKALPDLVELLAELDTKRMVAVSFVPPRFSQTADPEAFRAAVREALRVGARANEETGLVRLDESCG